MNQTASIQLVECPRDAMQGWKRFIPTEEKVAYLNALLQVGFHTLDCGSFVSPKAIPQMADTAAVLPQLQLSGSSTRLLAIVANVRGAAEAAAFPQLSYLGFPFSVSETFQQRNTNSSITQSLERVREIQQLCVQHNKELVVYLSMGFGNPYNDPWSPAIVFDWAQRLRDLGIGILSLADTVGLASPQQVSDLTGHLVQAMPDTTIGVHLHSTAHNWQAKLDAALDAGCRRFDGALKGIGGCPMAHDELVGNMNTEWMLQRFQQRQLPAGIDPEALARCSNMAASLFV
ncbi:MAG: hydroxymethylglutaryl-CoA lyase [Candidatus Pseudobacter hemicellulosilyticus]|uniref:Hydroxymethylglutaryl-CoA lyase n=1 Tax=Candidatus Pseudobacter hemicellulosilyticus TaxID=3121375 RepID=A0AAJ5WMR3_9BACT|nr:MAG: hydroxymethylglutaryl-CoA lyase [Pseudobacter sp.]